MNNTLTMRRAHPKTEDMSNTRLASFSGEHQEILAFIIKVKQGIANNTAPERIGAFCRWFYDSYLLRHMREEELLVADILPEDNFLRYTLFQDHEAIAAQTDEVTDNPTYASIRRLAGILYYHIRFEEKVLFSFIRTHFKNDHPALARRPQATRGIVKWNDEFWSNININHN